MAKTVFSASATGQTPAIPVKGGAIIKLTLSGTGTAQLEINLDGDWIGIRTADTATIALATAINLPVRDEPYLMRWNVTANNGTVTTYIN